jgi:flagellar basal body-associated protein FliL
MGIFKRGTKKSKRVQGEGGGEETASTSSTASTRRSHRRLRFKSSEVIPITRRGSAGGGDDSTSTAGMASLQEETTTKINATDRDDIHCVSNGIVINQSTSNDGDDDSPKVKSSKRRRSSVSLGLSPRKKETNRRRLLTGEKLMELSKRIEKERKEHNIWTSNIATQIYGVLFLFICKQEFWVLQGISIVIVLNILGLLSQWFVHVTQAKEIRTCKNVASWWIKFGLNLATNTAEGKTLQMVVTSISLHVWSTLGQHLTINFLQETFREHRKNLIKEAKASLHRSQQASRIHGVLMKTKLQLHR